MSVNFVSAAMQTRSMSGQYGGGGTQLFAGGVAENQVADISGVADNAVLMNNGTDSISMKGSLNLASTLRGGAGNASYRASAAQVEDEEEDA